MFFRKCVLAIVGAMLVSTAFAQDFPTRALTIIVPFAAGGGADVQTRVIAAEMSKDLGQPIIVENRPGATGNVGLESVAGQKPDGYTLLALANNTVMARNLLGQPFDLPKMLTPIGTYLVSPLLLIVNAKKIPAKNLSELVEYARAHPGTSYSSAGHGDGGHLSLATFAKKRGLEMSFVGYRGNAPALTALIGGELDILDIDGGSFLPQMSSPDVRVIAGSSTKRNNVQPNVPTATEQGFPEIAFDPVLGLSAPPNTPKPIVDRLAKALKVATESEAFKAIEAKVGNSVYFVDGEQFGKQLSDDYIKSAKAIKEADISAN